MFSLKQNCLLDTTNTFTSTVGKWTNNFPFFPFQRRTNWSDSGAVIKAQKWWRVKWQNVERAITKILQALWWWNKVAIGLTLLKKEFHLLKLLFSSLRSLKLALAALIFTELLPFVEHTSTWTWKFRFVAMIIITAYLTIQKYPKTKYSSPKGEGNYSSVACACPNRGSNIEIFMKFRFLNAKNKWSCGVNNTVPNVAD